MRARPGKPRIDGRTGVLEGERVDPCVGTHAILIIDLLDTIEIIIGYLPSHRLRASGPFARSPPISYFDGIVDSVVSKVEVLEKQLEGRGGAAEGWSRRIRTRSLPQIRWAAIRLY